MNNQLIVVSLAILVLLVLGNLWNWWVYRAGPALFYWWDKHHPVRTCPSCGGYKPGFGKCYDPATKAYTKTGWRDQGMNGGEVNAVVCDECDGTGTVNSFVWKLKGGPSCHC